MSKQKKSKLPLPRSVDPGWATVIAAVLALIGAIIALRPPIVPSNTPTQTSTEAHSSISQTIAPTQTENNQTSVPTQKAISPTSPPPTETASPSPSVNVLSDLPPDQRQVVQEAAAAILPVAQKLPLNIRDSFETNDYGWPIISDTYQHGVQCDMSVEDGLYHLRVQTTSSSGPSYCWAITPGEGRDFYLSFDFQTLENRIAEFNFYYRYTDESNFYYIIINQQTQILTMGVRREGEDRAFVPSKFVSEINKSSQNKLILIVTGSNHFIYINDQLIASITDETLQQGGFKLLLYLQEADQFEELQIDNFELRGK